MPHLCNSTTQKLTCHNPSAPGAPAWGHSGAEVVRLTPALPFSQNNFALHLSIHYTSSSRDWYSLGKNGILGSSLYLFLFYVAQTWGGCPSGLVDFAVLGVSCCTFFFFVSAQVSGLIWGNPTPPEISSNIFSNLLSYKGVRQEIASPMWIQRGIIFPVSELNLVPSVSAGNEWFHTPHLQLCLWASILRDTGHGVYSLPRSHGWAKKCVAGVLIVRTLLCSCIC